MKELDKIENRLSSLELALKALSRKLQRRVGSAFSPSRLGGRTANKVLRDHPLVDTPDSSTTKSNEGSKFDSGKPKMSLPLRQFPRALEAIVRASEYGNAKYEFGGDDWENFKRVPNAEERYRDAKQRHEGDRSRKYLDSESGLSHISHAAWNTLAELEMHLINKEKENDNNKK